MKIVNTMADPERGGTEETRLTLANAQALASRSIENLIGDQLSRVEDIDLDNYLATAMADAIDKVKGV